MPPKLFSFAFELGGMWRGIDEFDDVGVLYIILMSLLQATKINGKDENVKI